MKWGVYTLARRIMELVDASDKRGLDVLIHIDEIGDLENEKFDSIFGATTQSKGETSGIPNSLLRRYREFWSAINNLLPINLRPLASMSLYLGNALA